MEGVFSSRSELFSLEGEGPASGSNGWHRRSAASLHASRDSLYRTGGAERQQRAGVIPLELLPRRCPVGERPTIIGHGQRFRAAHDDRHESIWVRRGRCPPCRRTFTVLPDWLAPSASYTLRCRRQACESIAAGDSAQNAAPDCKDSSRSPDLSTVRRWAQRRIVSVCCWFASTLAGRLPILQPPTILAWDFETACRILLIEARSP